MISDMQCTSAHWITWNLNVALFPFLMLWNPTLLGPTTMTVCKLRIAFFEHILLDKLKENLPFDEKILPDDILTDQPEKFYLSEIIREKIFTNLYQEVPYRIAVVVEEIIEKKKIIVIQAYIVAESSHHKQIIIGKKGQMIKKVGEESRVDIQEFLNCKVFLDLRVKVDSQWLKIKDKAFNYSNI